MSKMNEHSQQLEETRQAYYWKFMDFIYDNLANNQLSDDDICKLEETQQRASSVSKQMIPNSTLNTYQREVA